MKKSMRASLTNLYTCITIVLVLVSYEVSGVGDSSCSNGIKSSDKTICCPSYCQTCGGTGCQNRPGGSYNCCSGTIQSYKKSCATNSAPCMMSTTTTTVPSDPTCANGIKNSENTACCTKTCGACGGSTCANRYGGATNCCTTTITTANKSCSSNVAPCKITSTSTGGTSSGNVKRATHVGLLISQDNWEGAERTYGVQLSSGLTYQEIGVLSFWNVQQKIEQGFETTLVIEIVDSYPNESSVTSGKYDAKLKAFGYAAAKYGKTFSVRTLHEGNGDWYSWGIFRGGSNSESNFKAAWIHIVNLLRSTGAPIQFELSLNNQNPRDNPRGLVNFFPGDQYVDRICISAYNRCGVDRWHTQQDSFKTVFGPAYAQVAAFTNKPICVGETSTTAYCGSKSDWIRAAWQSLTYDFPRVTHVYWFLENKSPYYWALNSANEQTAWIDGYKAFKTATA